MSVAYPSPAEPFTIAVISDTQNYVDYRNQADAGFPFNAREMLLDMAAHIARNARGNGGDIVFATGLGDSWEHPSSNEPDAHHAAGGTVPNPLLDAILPASSREVREIEVPAVVAAYRAIGAALPFSVVPGNHDHDHCWTDPQRPPTSHDTGLPLAALVANLGGLHVGALTNWTAAFGDRSPLFEDKPWYVASFRDGADSAHVFEGGGYRFLHLGLEMCPDDDVIDWAQAVLERFPGLPTIVSIHEFIDSDAERRSADVLDLTRLDPTRNTPQRLWEKLISPNDQIFLTLNGHFHGVAERVDHNDHGHDVYQFLVNYQSRKQSLKAAAPGANVLDGIGDGWLRFLIFDLGGKPRLRLRAYSTYYKAFASDLPDYAAWYGHEHPELSPSAFLALDEQEIALDDFQERFGLPSGFTDRKLEAAGYVGRGRSGA